VVVRDNGQTTYFASDIAYHMDKLERGFERVIDIWGADHHGYVPRVKAALQALGDDPARLDVLLVQFAILYRGGEKAQMSTRSGEFVTLRELRQEVGPRRGALLLCDAQVRAAHGLRPGSGQVPVLDNPVYYVQYAHARVCSVLRQAGERASRSSRARGTHNLERLTESHEQACCAPWPLSRGRGGGALKAEPHQMAHYLRELANEFHTYYNAHQFLVEDAALRDARIKLILAVRQVLRNGLGLIGVSAPESMSFTSTGAATTATGATAAGRHRGRVRTGSGARAIGAVPAPAAG
jgi:arginyl-tRNA synthetase